mmetsp:Transcript_12432/g.24928  ORF Transcript_12432/g.24928 Transcript_12432/m.24928 type:complete len:208 (+) Transcript_12432:1103-1726(+)
MDPGLGPRSYSPVGLAVANQTQLHHEPRRGIRTNGRLDDAVPKGPDGIGRRKGHDLHWAGCQYDVQRHHATPEILAVCRVYRNCSHSDHSRPCLDLPAGRKRYVGRCRLHVLADADQHVGIFGGRKNAAKGPQSLRFPRKNDERDLNRYSHHQVLRLGATLWKRGCTRAGQGNGRPHQNVLRGGGRLFHHFTIDADYPTHLCLYDLR